MPTCLTPMHWPATQHRLGSRPTFLCMKEDVRNLNCTVAAEMELCHILWPTDPGIQRPGDPVDPVTLFYNELQMSKKYSQAKEFLIMIGKSKSSLHGLTYMISVQQQASDNHFCHFSISNVRFEFWAFFRKPEKLGCHTGSKWWPGDPDVKDDPNDPLTRWPNDPVPRLWGRYRRGSRTLVGDSRRRTRCSGLRATVPTTTTTTTNPRATTTPRPEPEILRTMTSPPEAGVLERAWRSAARTATTILLSTTSVCDWLLIFYSRRVWRKRLMRSSWRCSASFHVVHNAALFWRLLTQQRFRLDVRPL